MADQAILKPLFLILCPATNLQTDYDSEEFRLTKGPTI